MSHLPTGHLPHAPGNSFIPRSFYSAFLPLSGHTAGLRSMVKSVQILE